MDNDFKNFPDFQDFSNMDQTGPDPQMVAMFARALINKDGIGEEDATEVDTTGAELLFARFFVTADMSIDFPVVAIEFVRHCHDHLEEYYDLAAYNTFEYDKNHSGEFFQALIIDLIYTGVRCGDEYCRALLKTLYKTYYKQEYNKLKRFSRISSEEIESIAEDDPISPDDAEARLLIMCYVLGIEVSPDCILIYLQLKKEAAFYEYEECERTFTIEELDWENEFFMECRAQVDEWLSEEKKKDIEEQNRVYYEGLNFISDRLRHSGYSSEFVELAQDNVMGLPIQLTRTLVLLKKSFPKRNFSFDEVQKYCCLYDAVSAVIDISEREIEHLEILMGLRTSFEDYYEDCAFKPENIVPNQKILYEKLPENNTKLKLPIEQLAVTNDELLAEIEQLRLKNREKDRKLHSLMEAQKTMKEELSEARMLVRQAEEEHEELLALREQVFSEETEEIPDGVSLDEMRDKISSQRITIIGGHITWIKKLRQEFPEWTYIQNDDLNQYSEKSLINSEQVFFFTDHMSHTLYGRCMNIIRKDSIPFGYLHGVNIEKSIRDIYSSLNK